MIDKEKNTNYNAVIDALKCVAINHGLVHSVSAGNIDSIDTDADAVYPLVHIVPGNVTAGVQQITFSFNVIAMDLVKKDESNEQQVLSDTLQILVDIIAQYKNGLFLKVQQNDSIYGQTDDTSYSLEPFTERFDNVVSGWNCILNLTVPANYYACDNFNDSAAYDGGAWVFTDGGLKDCTVGSLSIGILHVALQFLE